MREKISGKRKAKCAALNVLMYASVGIICLVLLGIIGYILYRGLPHISVEFLTSKPSLLKGTTGIFPNILNTLYLIIMTLIIVLIRATQSIQNILEGLRPKKNLIKPIKKPQNQQPSSHRQ